MAVTVTNTRERQEAIATANTHGAKFFVTGGKHVILNDMFIAAEIYMRKAEAVEREKEKKSRVGYHVRREAALLILDRLKHCPKRRAGIRTYRLRQRKKDVSRS